MLTSLFCAVAPIPETFLNRNKICLTFFFFFLNSEHFIINVGSDPALVDSLLSQKLRSNRERALSSLEEVINKFANKQDDTEEEERRKRLEKEKPKKEVRK